MKLVLHLSAVALLAFALAACGQKGPLYLPAKAPASAVQTAPVPVDGTTPASK